MIYLVAGVSFLAGAGVVQVAHFIQRRRVVQVQTFYPTGVQQVVRQRCEELAEENPHLSRLLRQMVDRTARR